MNSFVIAALLLALMAFAYRSGSHKSQVEAQNSSLKMHSRPSYHGWLVVIYTLLPVLLVLGGWALFSDAAARSVILGQLPADIVEGEANALRAVIDRVESIASGFGVSGTPEPFEVQAADALRDFQNLMGLIVTASAAGLGVLALLFARSRVNVRLRARNQVEAIIQWALIACSAVAILTTLGIVASLLTEAIRFFSFISPADFFFGTVWNPRFSTVGTGGEGDYGLLPLLSGTIMVSAIAMVVAVPIGLMSAIYLSQYADYRVRNFVKPIIEVLAGIPTIVYGFFAIVTVGPFLSEFGAMLGLEIRATSAVTAGAVMGIMIIPFISSLSEDILRQVPRAMSEGSLGLGATQSETIRNVLLPAALPGIVGAFLLAISRAIGETMIVVLAAGNSPVLRANPFEPTSTVTVTIVNQLTGDTDFAGPQSLVAFALGLTLFVMTLLLNVVALVIVRKFREQYD